MNINFRYVEDYIFFRSVGSGYSWQLLTHLNEPFTSLNDAIEYIRKNDDGTLIELSGFKQMKLNNGEWNNF